jgi:hypothetical protein
MQNWKDTLLGIISLLVLLLGGERVYNYAAAAPPAEATAPSSYELSEDPDIRATRYELRVTYEVTRQVQAPGGLPGGNVYTHTFLYPHQEAIVLYLRRPPTLKDILYVPPALKEEKHAVHSFTILSERRPVLDDKPIEKNPETIE